MSRSILAVGLTSLMLVAAACGDDEEEPAAGGGGSATTEESAGPAIKVGLVTDIGGLNDRSFNRWRTRASSARRRSSGIEVRVITSDQNSDYVPNLSTLAQQKYDLVIANGFLMAEATATVAKTVPRHEVRDHRLPPGRDEGQAHQRAGPALPGERGRLPRRLPRRPVRQGQRHRHDLVGRGQKVPPVDHYIAGYDAGAKAANPKIKTLNGYSQDFVDQAKCKEIALDQIERGSGVVFAGRRPVRPRRARRGQGGGRAGRSASTPTSPTSASTSSRAP